MSLGVVKGIAGERSDDVSGVGVLPVTMPVRGRRCVTEEGWPVVAGLSGAGTARKGDLIVWVALSAAGTEPESRMPDENFGGRMVGMG